MLFIGQPLSWFALMFEKCLPMLNNFNIFLEAFTKTFGEHDKAQWAKKKIRSLQQGTHSTLTYTSNFLIVCM